MSQTISEPVSADPAPLGLFATALPSWLLGMLNTGWFAPDNAGLLIAVVFAFGGGAQVIAGCFAYGRNDTLGFTGFTAFGAFWWSLALYLLFFKNGVSPVYASWYFFLFGLIALALLCASLGEAVMIRLFFAAITLSFFSAALGGWLHSLLWTAIGGYFTLLLAAISVYLAFAGLLVGAKRPIYLPIGGPAAH